MKKLLVLLVIVAAGYFVYQKFVAGKQSEELKQVQVLAEDFAAADPGGLGLISSVISQVNKAPEGFFQATPLREIR